jgi:hypothetical protein
MNEEQLYTVLSDIAQKLDRIVQLLETEQSHTYQRTPEGLPICPKHGVPMKKREKQGDTWYSHAIVDPATGEVMTDANGKTLYCRGYASKSSPGWDIEPDRPRSREANANHVAAAALYPASSNDLTNFTTLLADHVRQHTLSQAQANALKSYAQTAGQYAASGKLEQMLGRVS